MTDQFDVTAGRALAVLWRQFRKWENTIPWLFKNGTLKRLYLASKCKALIEHDRILRGQP
jgi:hypothetical protein